MDILSKFGENFAELIFDANFTPETLSQAVGIDRSMIYRYLRKEYLPTLAHAVAIADLLQCSLDFLFGLSEVNLKVSYLPAPPFCERFRALLAQKGVSRYRLCREIAVSPQSADDWYHGRRTPGVESALVLARYFDLTLDELLGREN